MKKAQSQMYGFDVFGNWHCRFPVEKLTLNGQPEEIVISEPRIEQLANRLNLEGMYVLELGCLEGMHSWLLQRLGAREVVAIEGRKDNFLKCLIVKNSFNLNKCKFLFGNVTEILPVLSGPFDVCLAVGILYHLQDPVSLIYKIAQLANNLFVWTHYSTRDYPKGPLCKINYQGRVYHGKYVKEKNKDCLSSLDEYSFWIFEDDVLKVVEDAGFKNIDLIKKGEHGNSPVITFLARK